MDPLGATTSSDHHPALTLTGPSTTKHDPLASGGDLSIGPTTKSPLELDHNNTNWDWSNGRSDGSPQSSPLDLTPAVEGEAYSGDTGLINKGPVNSYTPTSAPWSTTDDIKPTKSTNTPDEFLGQVPALSSESNSHADDRDLVASKMEEEAKFAMEQTEEDEAVEAAVARLMTSRERFRRGLIGFGRYLRTRTYPSFLPMYTVPISQLWVWCVPKY